MTAETMLKHFHISKASTPSTPPPPPGQSATAASLKLTFCLVHCIYNDGLMLGQRRRR